MGQPRVQRCLLAIAQLPRQLSAAAPLCLHSVAALQGWIAGQRGKARHVCSKRQHVMPSLTTAQDLQVSGQAHVS
jgi:hypothetical protein